MSDGRHNGKYVPTMRMTFSSKASRVISGWNWVMGVAELEERTGSVGAIIVIGPIRREDDLIRSKSEKEG